MFYSCYFSFVFESRSLAISVKTPLYLYFIALLCQVKFLVEVDARFEFLHRNRFLLSTVLSSINQENLKKSEMFCAWSSYKYATFVSSKFFDLSNGSALKKFVFTDCSILTDYVSFFALSLVDFK